MKAKAKGGSGFKPVDLVITFTSQEEVDKFYLACRFAGISDILGTDIEVVDALKPFASDSSYNKFIEFCNKISGTVL